METDFQMIKIDSIERKNWKEPNKIERCIFYWLGELISKEYWRRLKQD